MKGAKTKPKGAKAKPSCPRACKASSASPSACPQIPPSATPCGSRRTYLDEASKGLGNPLRLSFSSSPLPPTPKRKGRRSCCRGKRRLAQHFTEALTSCCCRDGYLHKVRRSLFRYGGRCRAEHGPHRSSSYRRRCRCGDASLGAGTAEPGPTFPLRFR